jgi:hypothetical protein
MNLGTALSKPFSNVKNYVTGLILSIIPIVSTLTIPGYTIRIASRTMNNDNSLPGFENFGELVVDSIKYLIVWIVYLVPAVVVLLVTVGSAFMTAAASSAASGSGASFAEAVQVLARALGAVAGLIVLGVVLGILGCILIASGILNYARTRQFGKAFAVVENFKNFFTGGFIAAVIVSIVLLLVFGGIATALAGAFTGMGVPIVGLVIAGIINYAVLIAVTTLLAEGYPHSAATPAPAAPASPVAPSVEAKAQ